MRTQLLICLKANDALASNDIEFYQSEKWDAESETQLIHHLHELLAAVRQDGRKLLIHLDIEVDSYARPNRNLHEALRKECVYNDQKLSTREVEVLGLIMQGYTNKHIAEKLYISFETVRSHRKNILIKTGMSNTAALVNHYHQTFFDKG